MSWEWTYNLDEFDICQITLTQQYKNESYSIKRHLSMESLLKTKSDFLKIIVRMMWQRMRSN